MSVLFPGAWRNTPPHRYSKYDYQEEVAAVYVGFRDWLVLFKTGKEDEALVELIEAIRNDGADVPNDMQSPTAYIAGRAGQCLVSSKKRLKIGYFLRAIREVRKQGHPVTIHVAKRLAPDFLGAGRIGIGGTTLAEFCGKPGRDASTRVDVASVASEIRENPRYQAQVKLCLEAQEEADEYRAFRKKSMTEYLKYTSSEGKPL